MLFESVKSTNPDVPMAKSLINRVGNKARRREEGKNSRGEEIFRAEENRKSEQR